jgi:hypothetical protein
VRDYGVFAWDRMGQVVVVGWPNTGGIYVRSDGSGLVKGNHLDWLNDHQYLDTGEHNDRLEFIDPVAGTLQILQSEAPNPEDYVAVMSPDKTSVAIATGTYNGFFSSDSIIVAGLNNPQSSSRQISTPSLDLSYELLDNGKHIFQNDVTWESYDLAWSPDSSMLAFALDDKASDSNWPAPQRSLVVVSRDGTELWRVNIPDLPGGMGLPISAIQWVPCES